MADEGLESGDAAMAASAVNGPSAADVDQHYQQRLREAVLALLDQRQPSFGRTGGNGYDYDHVGS